MPEHVAELAEIGVEEIYEIGVEEVCLASYSDVEEARRAATEYPTHRFFDSAGNRLHIGDREGDVTFRAEIRDLFRFALATADQHPEKLKRAGYSSPSEFARELEDVLAYSELDELVPMLRVSLKGDADVDRASTLGASRWCCFFNRKCCR